MIHINAPWRERRYSTIMVGLIKERLLHQATRYRNLAMQTISVADTMTTEVGRHTLLNIARDYARLSLDLQNEAERLTGQSQPPRRGGKDRAV